VLQRFTAEAALRFHTKGFAEGLDALPQAPPVLERREDQAEMAGVDPRLWRLRFAAVRVGSPAPGPTSRRCGRAGGRVSTGGLGRVPWRPSADGQSTRRQFSVSPA
jgi:hypothetical protein